MMSSAKLAKSKAKSKKGKGKEKEKETATKPASKGSSTMPPATVPVSRAPVEVVFSDMRSTSTVISKAEKRAFLNGNSAKMMGLQPEDQPGTGKRKRRSEDDEEEQ